MNELHKLSEVRYRKPEGQLRHHQYSNIFPMMQGMEYQQFVHNIRQNGVLEPIVFLHDAILDGRNRYRAASGLGVEYPYVQYEGADPLGYVVSLNVERRHLDESQRAMIAATIADLPFGSNQHVAPANVPTQAEAAEALNVSERSVRSAKKVQREGASELVDAVSKGDVKVGAAAEIATLPVEEQVEIIKQADPKAFSAVAKQIRKAKSDQKKVSRTEREVKLAEKISELPEQKYGVILADPEWHDEQYSDETGMDRHTANHYPTSTTDVIASRPVSDIAADDCVLMLWSTNQHLKDAIFVMSEWGFEYQSNYVWVKPSIGLGRWNRSRHEILLIGTRGSPVPPAQGEQWDSVIEAPRRDHSAKPEKVAEMIEEYWPNVPKIELNRRGLARSGWSAWGNEAEVERG